MRERQVGRLTAGRLVEHGRAHFRFQAAQDLSYFVRVLTSEGERTLWGKDLDRAISSSATRPKIGDLVGVRLTAREPVAWTEPLNARDGRLIARVEHKRYKNVWQVEQIGYFGARAVMARRIRDAQADVRQTVRNRPELKSSFLSVRAAQAFAQERIGDPQDRERFVELVRDALAASIHKGEPMPDVRLRDTARTAARGIMSLRAEGRADERSR